METKCSLFGPNWLSEEADGGLYSEQEKHRKLKKFTLTLLHLVVPVSHDSDWALNGMQK